MVRFPKRRMRNATKTDASLIRGLYALLQYVQRNLFYLFASHVNHSQVRISIMLVADNENTKNMVYIMAICEHNHTLKQGGNSNYHKPWEGRS